MLKGKVSAGLAVVAVLAMIGCGGHRHLGLEVHGTTPGQRFVCRSGAPTCEHADSTAPSDETTDARFYALPSRAECSGGVHKIFVRNADTSSPEVIVTCASDERSSPSK